MATVYSLPKDIIRLASQFARPLISWSEELPTTYQSKFLFKLKIGNEITIMFHVANNSNTTHGVLYSINTFLDELKRDSSDQYSSCHAHLRDNKLTLTPNTYFFCEQSKLYFGVTLRFSDELLFMKAFDEGTTTDIVAWLEHCKQILGNHKN